ncbi:hypothetical protein SARC_01363 [Sphaeroforma arctica JP610]|uniref:Nudix hydrolase domain-containing protein n=1 Tax=Sphaeroforma arctica JP610 TaxID=667725 RepID=A0A0L0GBV2_9EUKA|nr:hypothetical protein SARC_01363 [Sphaeroforma arctica JP610]KNC86492.1 hypothetical protein SARC_01363 [Sphaeroforma arctica JP610]|eukprot:XP_014160394.1 hypothetical protein SARC_01363 [Sphaeroforma arctica JP610]
MTGEAAVLLILYIDKTTQELNVVLTQRSSKLKSHGGEVCLPGGKRDETDTDITMTALREANEEIGLDRDTVKVIGMLPANVAKNQLLVTPVAAVALPSFDVDSLKANEDEVALIFSVELAKFLSGEHHMSQEWTPERGMPMLFHSWEFEGTPRVWGLTAFFLIDLASVVYGRKPDYEMEPNVRDFVYQNRKMLRRETCQPGCLKC